MAALDFLTNGRRKITVLHFDHGTEHGSLARKFVEKICTDRNVPLIVGQISREQDESESMEEFWRNQRYEFFDQFSDRPIVTAHHLDDAIEWWIMTSLWGKPRLIPGSRGNVIRPFLTTPKSEFVEWCERKDVPYVLDPTNEEDDAGRNLVRNRIVPQALRFNPGLRKTVRKLIEEENVGC